MNGDQKAPASPSERPAYNPPSLTEPSVAPAQSLPTLPTPQPAAPSAPAAAVPSEVAAPASQPAATVAEPAPAPVETAQPEQPVPEQPVEEEAGFYHAGSSDEPSSGGDVASKPSNADIPAVEWTTSAASFQVHAGNWRLRMSIFGLVGGLLVFLITRSYFSSGAIILAGLLFGFLGSRAPRPISYRIDNRGIAVGQKYFSFAEFRAFSVSDVTPTINLVPLKRFSPIMVLRYDPVQATDIVKVLSGHLPMEAPKGNAVDGIVNRLKI